MKQVEIFTDGACKGNPGPGGWGALLRMGPHEKELVGGGLFTLAASILMLLPFAAVLIRRERVLPVLQHCKQLLFAHGELVVAGVSLVLGGYLGWQGLSGLTRI